MKKTSFLILLMILTSIPALAQKKSVKELSIEKMQEISFYTDYVWVRKSSDKEEDKHQNKLVKNKLLNGVASHNIMLDASDKTEKLSIYLQGVSGYDPVDDKIRFLDFSRDGMMVEGTISLVEENIIEYNFEFAFPGNKKKLIGRDVLQFNEEKTSFIWDSYVKSKDGEYRKINSDVMIRKEKV